MTASYNKKNIKQSNEFGLLWDVQAMQNKESRVTRS
jgi:hypothetical protein